MIVYVLLCQRDSNTEVGGVFDSMTKAVVEAQRLEQANMLHKGEWLVKSEKVQ